MKKAIFFIDGFNLYHSIDIPKYYKYKWLDLKKLSSLLIRANEKIVDVYFFTALTKWNKDKQARHKILIKALESTGMKTIYGKFKKQEVRCPCCNRVFQKHVEKKTDVNIATLLIQFAFLNRFDKAYLLSGDSDLVPAVLSVKQIFPKKKIDVIFPISRVSKDLRKAADYSIKIKEHHLKQCIFEDPLVLSDNTILTCPESWK